MTEIRPYQERTITRAVAHPGHAVLVCPTGGGKTFMAAEIIKRTPGRAVCLAHRREIITQLVDATGAEALTIQGLLAKPYAGPPVSLLVIDECHHIVAEEWSTVIPQFPGAKIVGLTATPNPELSSVFDEMIVAAYHSELVRDGYLSPCEVYQPPEEVEGIAQHPLTAYQKYGKGQGFIFAPSIKESKKWTDDFNAFGIPARHIDGTTKKAVRDEVIAGFKSGEIQIISNVDILTEGFDAPGAETVILAKAYGSLQAFLQATGRVLRVAEGKSTAICIDLTGCTHIHGFPTDDREYILGEQIRRRELLSPLRNCPVCGFTQESVRPACQRCGHVYEKEDPRVLAIRMVELQRARNENTAEDEKRAELRRWVDRANERGMHYYVLAKHYKEKYGCKPDLDAVCTLDEKKNEASRLKRQFGFGKGAGMFKGLFK